MSVGGLRHTFSLRDNIEMAKYSAEFLRQVPQKLNCDGEAAPDIQFHPYGYLQLADEEHAQELQESWLKQKYCKMLNIDIQKYKSVHIAFTKVLYYV